MKENPHHIAIVRDAKSSVRCAAFALQNIPGGSDLYNQASDIAYELYALSDRLQELLEKAEKRE